MPLPYRVLSPQHEVKVHVIWHGHHIGRMQVDRSHSHASGSGADAIPNALSLKQTIRRPELRKIVPLADTTIYEMEQRGEFPQRFYLTPRCVVWSLAEVEDWIEQRRRASNSAAVKRAPSPDVRQRKTRPVKG
jgi:prophage regulatory protein